MELAKCHMTVSKRFYRNAMLAKYGLTDFWQIWSFLEDKFL